MELLLPHPPIEIGDALTIATAEETRRRLLTALEDQPEIVVDLGPVTAADVFGLQLLLAARRGAQQRGKVLQLLHAGAAVQQACTAAGLEPAQLGLEPTLPTP